MGKCKSNKQKRDIREKQKRNRANKATMLRNIMKRDFNDMSPMPSWKFSEVYHAIAVDNKKALARAKEIRRCGILFRKFLHRIPGTDQYGYIVPMRPRNQIHPSWYAVNGEE